MRDWSELPLNAFIQFTRRVPDRFYPGLEHRRQPESLVFSRQTSNKPSTSGLELQFTDRGRRLEDICIDSARSTSERIQGQPGGRLADGGQELFFVEARPSRLARVSISTTSNVYAAALISFWARHLGGSSWTCQWGIIMAITAYRTITCMICVTAAMISGDLSIKVAFRVFEIQRLDLV